MGPVDGGEEGPKRVKSGRASPEKTRSAKERKSRDGRVERTDGSPSTPDVTQMTYVADRGGTLYLSSFAEKNDSVDVSRAIHHERP